MGSDKKTLKKRLLLHVQNLQNIIENIEEFKTEKEKMFGKNMAC